MSRSLQLNNNAHTLFAGLDARLLKAISRLGYVRPTVVQAKAIPLALSGRDVLVRAATGAGKTAAYGLVALQKVLQHKASSKQGPKKGSSGILALVLVPTRELVEQTASVLLKLAHYCSDTVAVLGLGAGSVAEQAGKLALEPDVLVSTPARAAQHIKAGSLSLSSCLFCVLDEADMTLSYGHGGDVRLLTAALPRGCQGMLLSATLSNDLTELKRLVLHSPAILKLDDGPQGGAAGAGGGAGLTQLYVRVPRADKYLLLYSLLRLKLIQGKTLIFVSDVNAGYKLKLVLERFSIRSAVLNAELPHASRAATVAGFNKGLFDLLIATDSGLEQHGQGEAGEGVAEEGEESAPSAAEAGGKRKRDKGEEAKKAKRKMAKIAPDIEYGVSRGLDFQGVTTVLNFDFPSSSTSYIHRVGRTARGGASGVALSLLAPEGVEETQDAVLKELQSNQPVDPASGQPVPALLPFDTREVEPFRYRVEDMVRSVTDKAVKEARLEEIRREILASAALRGHFEDNPRDLVVLQTSASSSSSSGPGVQGLKGGVKAHLKHIPDYLLPPSLRQALEAAGSSVDQVLAAGKRKRRKAKSSREKAREVAQAAMSAASAAQVAASLAEGPAAAIPSMDMEAEEERPRDLVSLAQADAYSRHGGMRGSSKSGGDPLKTFTYQARKSAALGMHLPGSTAQQQAAGEGGKGSKSSALIAAMPTALVSAAPRIERVVARAAERPDAAEEDASAGPVDITAMVHKKLAGKSKK